MVTAKQIVGKDYFNQTLKLIAQLAQQTDVVNLDTAYLIVNIQAVRQLKKCKNRYALRQFLTPDNWLKVKDTLVPSCQLTLKKLVFVGVHINLDGKIQPEAPILPLLPTQTIDTPECISPPSAPAQLFYTTVSSGRPYFQTIETPKHTTALLRTESMMF